MLKMANGISLLFADDADDKNDYKNQITAFQFLYLMGLMQREALVRFACVPPFVICNTFSKIFAAFDLQP
jgi:hypothetical protein